MEKSGSTKGFPANRKGPISQASGPAFAVEPLPGHRQKFAPHTAQLHHVAPVMRRVHQKCERHLEHLGHFERIGSHFETRSHEGDHRCDDEARAGGVDRQCAEHVHMRRMKSDLLPRLAQRGGGRVTILGFGAPARKTDLAGMVAQVIRALRQQHCQFAAFDQRHQHRCVGRRAFDEARLGGDLGRPERRRQKALAQRGRAQLQPGDRRQVVIDADDRQFLGG